VFAIHNKKGEDKIMVEELQKNFLEKISSYNIFNNFFPGLIFCYLVKRFTRFSFEAEEVWVTLFIYYFWGMMISRMGSIIIEKILSKILVKNKVKNIKEPFINMAPYNQYCEASEKKSFIKILSETNNTYRTMISVMFSVIIVKLYDFLLVDWINSMGEIMGFVIQIMFLFFAGCLFIVSYRKQTNYVRWNVERYMNEKEK